MLTAIATFGAATVVYAAFVAQGSCQRRLRDRQLVALGVGDGARVTYPNGGHETRRTSPRSRSRSTRSGPRLRYGDAADVASAGDLGYRNSRLTRLSIVVTPAPLVPAGAAATIIVDGLYLDESADNRRKDRGVSGDPGAALVGRGPPPRGKVRKTMRCRKLLRFPFCQSFPIRR